MFVIQNPLFHVHSALNEFFKIFRLDFPLPDLDGLDFFAVNEIL